MAALCAATNRSKQVQLSNKLSPAPDLPDFGRQGCGAPFLQIHLAAGGMFGAAAGLQNYMPNKQGFLSVPKT